MKMMGIQRFITRKNIIIGVTFCLILAVGILTKQHPLFMIPLFVSLIVMALQSEVNRIAFLVGGINSCIYAAVYVSMGLYASAASALLFSCPFQLVAFFNWKRKAYGKATVFKKLSTRMRVILGVASVLIFGVVQAILMWLGSNYAVLDNISFVNGVLVNVLSVLAYIEYIYLQFAGGFLTIALNVQVMLSKPAHSTYLVFSLYSLYCLAVAFRNVRRIYKEQQGNTLDSHCDRK